MNFYKCENCDRKFFTTLDVVHCCSHPIKNPIGNFVEYEKRCKIHFPELIYLNELVEFMLRSVKSWADHAYDRWYEAGSTADVPENDWKVSSMDNSIIIDAMIEFIKFQKINCLFDSNNTFEDFLIENYKICIWFEDEDDDYPEDTSIQIEITKKEK